MLFAPLQFVAPSGPSYKRSGPNDKALRFSLDVRDTLDSC